MREATALSWLVKYKRWLTLADAAKYLNKSPDMNVTETDLLWLALEGRLKIAARFPYPIPATIGTTETLTGIPEHIALEPFPLYPGIKGEFDLLSTPETLLLNKNGDLESSEILGGFVFNTDVPGKVVMIGTRTLPETAYWVIQSRDLLEFESKTEEFSNPLPAPLIEKIPTIGISEPLQVQENPKRKTNRQEQAVIEILIDLGCNPKALPPRQPGLPWVKSDVRKAALNRRNLFTEKSFDNTWERLRASWEILELTRGIPSEKRG